MHTLFYFLLALGVLISFHEYGHFIAARKMGVKVLRFSLGFGKTLWRYQKSDDSTEFVIGALPLGGYVKMVDEREGEVDPEDLPFAFNRQNLIKRSIIVFAGPFFNFLLAVLLYWIVFMVGETGMRPVLGPVASATLAADAGFSEGDEIQQVGDTSTPTWNLAMNAFLEAIVVDDKVSFLVKDRAGQSVERILAVPSDLSEQPEKLHERVGFQPWQPPLTPVIERVEPGSAAERAGLRGGDLSGQRGRRCHRYLAALGRTCTRPSRADHATCHRPGRGPTECSDYTGCRGCPAGQGGADRRHGAGTRRRARLHASGIQAGCAAGSRRVFGQDRGIFDDDAQDDGAHAGGRGGSRESEWSDQYRPVCRVNPRAWAWSSFSNFSRLSASALRFSTCCPFRSLMAAICCFI